MSLTEMGMAAPLNQRDFAIVIGISRYEDSSFLPDIVGADEDAEAFAHWLTDPNGGALAQDNVVLLTNASRSDAEDAFNYVFERFDREPGRRLYLYGSGQGFANDLHSASLLMADASRQRLGNSIDLPGYANAFFFDGLFREVVLFTDFGRESMPRATSPDPVWTRSSSTQKDAARFYGFSSKGGSQSYTLLEPDPYGVHALFTRSLLEGLRGGAADKNGRIDSSSLQRFVESSLPELAQESGAPWTVPEFHSGGARPIVFAGPEEEEAVEPVQSEAPDNDASSDVEPTQRALDLVLSQLGLADSQVSNEAKYLLVAAIELLPQKQSSKDTLSSTQLFIAAVTWGAEGGTYIGTPDSLKSFARAVLTESGEIYESMLEGYFQTTPPRVAFFLGPTFDQDIKVSDTLRQAMKGQLSRGEAITESSLLGAVLEFMSTDEGSRSRLSARLREMMLDPIRLLDSLQDEPEDDNEDSDLRRGYTNDGVDAARPEADKLNVNEQARLFAELVTDPQVKPPLSIGLFGNWGSGKSFFIDRMAGEIESLEGQPGRISRVVQVKFNAWHFADANLWASLATKILDDVADEFAKDVVKVKPSNDAETQRAELRSKIESSRQQRSQANQELQNAITERSAAVADYKSKRSNRIRAALRLGQDRWAKLEEMAVHDPGLKEAVDGTRQVAAQLGFDDVLESADGLEKLLKETRNARHSVSSLGRTFMADLRQPSGLLVSLVLPAGAVLLVAYGAISIAEFTMEDVSEQWRQLSTLVATWGAPLAGVVTWVTTRMQGIARGAKHVETLIKDAKTLDFSEPAELKELDKEIHSAQTKIDEAERRQARYEQELQRIDAGGLVYDFLESRRDNEAYLKHKGLISIVRDDLQNLQSAMQKLQGERPVDRIVLYIDDLDRCRPTRVVEVLEAVHMLLSFELFCVVVAVDSRWIRSSLEKSYRSLTDGGDTYEEGGQPFTAQNYLEKIFQIPFSLARMDRDGFANLVDAVLEPPPPAVERTEADIQPSDADPGGADNKTLPTPEPSDAQSETDADATQQAESSSEEDKEHSQKSYDGQGLFANLKAWWKSMRNGDSPPKEGSEESPTTGLEQTKEQADAAQEEARPDKTASSETEPADEEEDQIEEPIEAVTLEEHERLFIHTLHEFVKTPRQTKRFLNIYRLLRPRPGTGALVEFAAQSEDAGYKCVLLLLAVNTGYPAPGGKLLRALVRCPVARTQEDRGLRTWGEFLDATAPSNSSPAAWADIWSGASKEERGVANELYRKLRSFQPHLSQRQTSGIDYELPGDLDDYQRFARDVGRYSFDWNMILSADNKKHLGTSNEGDAD